MKVAWSVITSETQLGWESRDQPAPTERCESTARFLILSTASEAQLPSTDTVCVQTHTHSVCIDSVCVYRDPVCCCTGPVVPVVPASELQDGVYLRTTEIHWKLEDKISGKRWAETRWIYLSFWLLTNGSFNISPYWFQPSTQWTLLRCKEFLCAMIPSD